MLYVINLPIFRKMYNLCLMFRHLINATGYGLWVTGYGVWGDLGFQISNFRFYGVGVMSE